MASLASRSRFKTIAVSKRVSIKALIEGKSLMLTNDGHGFYQLNEPKFIQDCEKVVMRRRSDGKIISGDEVLKILGEPKSSKNYTLNPAKVPKFDVFVQSISVNRVLLPGTEFLYEIEEEEGTEPDPIPKAKRRGKRRSKRKPKATATADTSPLQAEQKKDTADGAGPSVAKKSMAVSPCPLEIVFSFDTTASMHPCLNQVRQKITETVKRLQKEIPGIRIAIIGHGDYSDGPEPIQIMNFSTDERELCNFVKELPETGGDDFSECYELVLNEVRERLSWTHGTKRSLVMIGDATPHLPTDPQNRRKLDWRVEAEKLYHILGVRIYAVQALNNSESDSFYETLASLTGGCHLHLDDFSSIDEFMIAIGFQETGRLQAYKDEVDKRFSKVNRSTQKLLKDLDERATSGRETTPSGSGDTERINVLRRQIVELETQLRLRRKQIAEEERKLSRQQEENQSKRERSEQEWQDRKKELKKQQDRSRHHVDLLQGKRHQQLSEALGLSEEKPVEVLEAYVTFGKGKVAATEKQTLIFRQEQLIVYQLQARDLAGRLQNYEGLLQRHMVDLKLRKEALEELERLGEKYARELTECDQQLKQLRETLELAQKQLRSCEEKLQEYKESIRECLDEMNRCEGSLSQSLYDLQRCLDRLKMLRKRVTDELSNMNQSIERGKNLVSILIQSVSQLFGYSNDQLEVKMVELQKCSKELEETECTLDRLKIVLQENETELGNLRECIRKAKRPQPTGTISGLCTQLRQYENPDQKPTEGGVRFMTQSEKSSSIHAQVLKNREKIIEFLSANVSPDRFATELEISGLINRDVREEAEVTTVATSRRIRPVMNAVITKLELSEENADKFKSVLKKLGVLDDLTQIIA